MNYTNTTNDILVVQQALVIGACGEEPNSELFIIENAGYCL